jgi:hypothetical protein
MIFLRSLITVLFGFCFTTSAAFAELKLESIYPYEGSWRQDLQVTLKGTGFDQNTRVSMSLDAMNKRFILGSTKAKGWAWDVAVAGNIAYVVYDVSGLQVIDVSNPTDPTPIGSVYTPEESRGVAVVGNTVYVANYSGLHIIDVINPSNPQIVGYVASAYKPNDVAVVGDKAYITSGLYGLEIIDVSNPANAKTIGSVETPAGASHLVVIEGIAYVTVAEVGLQVIDVSDPTAPKLIGSVNTPHWAYGVTVVGDIAYVAGGYAGLHIIDVQNPATPRILCTVNTSGIATSVTVAENIAYVADYTGIQIINVQRPTDARLLGTVISDGTPLSMMVIGGIAYVSAGTNGLEIIDVGHPTGLQFIGEVKTPGITSKGAIIGNMAYLVGRGIEPTDPKGWLRIIDVTNPSRPRIIGSLDRPLQVYDIEVVNCFAYVSDDRGLQVIDISNPIEPKIIGSVDVASYNTYVRSLAVAGDKLYMTGGGSRYPGPEGRLAVIDVSDPASPQIIASLETQYSARYVTVVADIAYVTEGNSLQVIDVSNPTDPKVIGSLNSFNNPLCVAVFGDKAYVANGCGGGLRVVSLTDQSNPEIIGSVDTSALDVQLEGDVAYVVDPFQVIDISNLQSPQIIASIDGPSTYVAVVGKMVYLDGFRIVPLPSEILPVTVNSETSISVTLPSPIMAGNYTIRVFKASESSEIVGAVKFSLSFSLADAINALMSLCGMHVNGDDLNIFKDVNGDGKVGMEEVVFVLQKISGLR